MNPGEKCCVECAEVLPDEPVHFPVFRKQCTMCIGCVTRRKRRAAAKKEEWRSRRMAKMERQAIDTLLKSSKTGGASVPHSAELLEQLMEFFGGTAGFGSILTKQYFDAKPGSTTRTKMLELVTRLVTTNADQGGSKRPLTFWSEDELNEEIEQRIQETAIGALARKTLTLEVESAPAEAE